MPSKCGFEGCDKKGSLQGKLPAVDKCLYFCSAGHMQAAGAVQTEKNRKQRQDCNAKILQTRKRKREDGAEGNADGKKGKGNDKTRAKMAEAGKEDGGKGGQRENGKDEGAEKKPAGHEGGEKADPPPPPPAPPAYVSLDGQASMFPSPPPPATEPEKEGTGEGRALMDQITRGVKVPAR